MNIPVVYDLNMQKVAYLENASTVSYEQPMNALHKAYFTLPANDPKNTECRPLRFVEIFDGDERIDLFRIVPHAARRDSTGQTITYQCEHVLATLLDDVMFQFHTIGNLGVYTRDVLEYILDQQLVQRWQLGTVNFARQFEYSWENENLLAALFSVPKPFVEEYMWTWDTTSYPWTLNLVEQPAVATDPNTAYIRYGHNMREIEREIDPTTLCTRLYCLGAGEGVNQLTIAEVNGGKPYLDADTQAQYGIISKIFVDRRFQHAETLLARGQALLEELKHPRITYRVKAADLGLQRFRTGSHVIVKDEDLGIDIRARIVNVRKPDITGAPGDVEIEIANRPLDIAGSIAELADRQRINDLYAQGATNWDSHDFADNCDPDNPAILRFYIPADTARINMVRLSYQVEAFRAYSRSIEAAPATSSGPSSTSTTSAGGGSTETTSAYGGFFGDTLGSEENIPDPIDISVWRETSNPWSGEAEPHTHKIPPHRHKVAIPSHSHTVNIPSHAHQMPHTHQIPSHTHDIEYGIFEGPTPTNVTVKVDGNVVPGLGVNEDDVDLIPYLAKDDGGKIQRGTWHTIEIAPNNLGRIVASVSSQIFVQSRGGGNY